MKSLRSLHIHWAYLIPAVFYNMWLLGMGWLNTYWSKLKLPDNLVTLQYIFFFVGLALSTAAFSLRFGKKTDGYIKNAIKISTACVFILSILVIFSSGLLFIIIFIVSGIGAGFMSTYLGYAIFAKTPKEAQPVTLAFSGGISTFLHFIIFTWLFPRVDVPSLTILTFFSAVMILLSGLFILYFPLCKTGLWSDAKDINPFINMTDKPKILPILFIVLVCFYLSYGMQDFAVTAYWLYGSGFLVYTRLFIVVGYFIGGFLWEMKYRHTILISGFGLLLMGFVCMAFEYRGIASFIGFASVQFASALLIVATRLVFIEIAGFYKNSVFIAISGFVAATLLKQLGILAAMVSYSFLGSMSVFIFSLLFVVSGLPFVSVLFDRIGVFNLLIFRKTEPLPVDLPQENIKEDIDYISSFISKYSLTRREGQVLELSNRGRSIAEMAASLNISEPTIKHYVKSILRKTDTKNQKQVLSLLHEGK